MSDVDDAIESLLDDEDVPRETGRSRWPPRNTSDLARHVAKQFPDLTRQQVAKVLTATSLAIMESLYEQERQGIVIRGPSVAVRGFGRFVLKYRKPYTVMSRVLERVVHIPGTWRPQFMAAPYHIRKQPILGADAVDNDDVTF